MAGHLRSKTADFQYSAIRTTSFRTFALLLVFLTAAISRSYGGSLDSTVIGMFPKDSGDFGYADLSQARQFPWYPQFEAQLVPVALFEFEQFLETAQMRSTSPMDQVAWANVGASPASPGHAATDHPGPGTGQPVAIAIGDFDIETIKSYLNSKNVSSIQIGNYVLYGSGTGSGSSNIFFAILDSQTIAFGPLKPLKRALKVRDGEEDSLLQNEPMMTLIESANGGSIFWGVLNTANAAHAIGRLIPEATKFPQSSELIGKLKEVLITVNSTDNIEIDLQARSPSPGDAMLLSQLLQAGVLMRRYEANIENHTEMAKVLNALSVGANGDLLDISAILTNDQILALIEHNTFRGL